MPAESHPAARNGPPRLTRPDVWAVVAGHGEVALVSPEGEIEQLAPPAAPARLRALGPVLVCHAPATARRLGPEARVQAIDLLELWAFVRPAQAVVPTPKGIAQRLDLDPPHDPVAAALILHEAAGRLLRELADRRQAPENRDAASLAALMGHGGWPWAPFVLAALGATEQAGAAQALRVWQRLPEWEESAPPPPPSHIPVEPAEARRRLGELLGAGAEDRPQQADFASAAAAAFAPTEHEGTPHVVLAEAGTGTGKTLAYIAPASLWAEKNHAPVWISTYTRNLQRQIDSEAARLFPDPAERRRRVVIRKGRENYLCLLNYEEAANAAAMNPALGVPMGLMARWIAATRDGDLQGGDFPAWLVDLIGPGQTLALADRRGECIHSACPHWRRCFIERTIRNARQADLVVANHALVMVQAAWGGLDDASLPLRYVFDEGHHLFDAADGAFSAALSGQETGELRRWLVGAEGGRSRARGLRRRIEDLIGDRVDLAATLEELLRAARALPAPGWQGRITEAPRPELLGAEPGAQNPTEAFLRLVQRQVTARAAKGDEAASLEADLRPPVEGLVEAALRLEAALARLETPLAALRTGLLARLDQDADTIETGMRIRIEAVCRSLQRRAIGPVQAWRGMLHAVAHDTPPHYVDWLAIERRDGRLLDLGMHRHWIDPTIPFAESVAARAHGILVTSATLRDAGEAEIETGWREAERRTGATHLPEPPLRAAVPSPFDYARQTQALVVTDINGADPDQVAAAYRELFIASGGGALGLFTAIARLRAVHGRIAPALAAAGLDLYAQHVDAMDNTTLVDIFRAEEDSCLLGTDAMRDGVDVPGRSLRLLVFDRVPWPRPDILHRARRLHFGKPPPDPRLALPEDAAPVRPARGGATRYDDRIARARLRQAFGRLVRRADDRGVFVLLDARTPSRLLSGLPEGVAVRRVGLAEAIAETRAFLGHA